MQGHLLTRSIRDSRHVDWIKSYYAVLYALEEYVKKNHHLGVTWNAKGIDAADALAASTALQTPSGSAEAAATVTAAAPSSSPPPQSPRSPDPPS